MTYATTKLDDTIAAEKLRITKKMRKLIDDIMLEVGYLNRNTYDIETINRLLDEKRTLENIIKATNGF